MMKNERMMMKNMMIGASIGAALSLFHKPTRDACGMKWMMCKNKVRLYRSNPELLKNSMITKLDDTKKLAQSLSDDLSFLNKQVSELKKTTPKVMELVEETKEHFSKKTTDN